MNRLIENHFNSSRLQKELVLLFSLGIGILFTSCDSLRPQTTQSQYEKEQEIIRSMGNNERRIYENAKKNNSFQDPDRRIYDFRGQMDTWPFFGSRQF